MYSTVYTDYIWGSGILWNKIPNSTLSNKLMIKFSPWMLVIVSYYSWDTCVCIFQDLTVTARRRIVIKLFLNYSFCFRYISDAFSFFHGHIHIKNHLFLIPQMSLSWLPNTCEQNDLVKKVTWYLSKKYLNK